MHILVIDGQGGGIGQALIAKLTKKIIGATLTAGALNEHAASAMQSAGAHQVLTGETAILSQIAHADLIMGAIGMICPGAMAGEISSRLASAISQSEADKILIPYNKCKLRVSGVNDLTLNALIEDAVDMAYHAIK